MRPLWRLALNVITGMVILALMWRWAYRDSRHAILDSATVCTLAIGFLAGCANRLRSKSARHDLKKTERRDALLTFSAEGLASEAPKVPSPATNDHIAWFTFLAHAMLMIALTWRWAFQREPYTVFGAVTLSTLMLGFFDASVTAFASLGSPAATNAPRRTEEENALLLFPAEDAAANDFVPASRPLATRRNALL
jgi:hypothetical protein